MPTKRRRHAITETPAVKAALDELRAELGTDKLPLAELVRIGARQRTAELRALREDGREAIRNQLADRILTTGMASDPMLADEVRHRGWARR